MDAERKQHLLEIDFGLRCPSCNSGNVTEKNVHGNGHRHFRVMHCHDCPTLWRNVFTLTDIELLPPPGGGDYDDQ